MHWVQKTPLPECRHCVPGTHDRASVLFCVYWNRRLLQVLREMLHRSVVWGPITPMCMKLPFSPVLLLQVSKKDNPGQLCWTDLPAHPSSQMAAHGNHESSGSWRPWYTCKKKQNHCSPLQQKLFAQQCSAATKRPHFREWKATTLLEMLGIHKTPETMVWITRCCFQPKGRRTNHLLLSMPQVAVE